MDDKPEEKPEPNEHAPFMGQVVRYHLARDVKTTELRRVRRGAKGRTELEKYHVTHKHWNAVLVAVTPDGVATLKVLPHRSQARRVVKADGSPHTREPEDTEDPKPHGSHIRLVEGVKRGTEGGEWSPVG